MIISVRRATAEDIPWLLSELKKFSEFMDTRRPLLDPETAPEIIQGFIETRVVFLAVRGNDRAGFIAGAIVPHFLNPKIRVLSETFFWVCEEFQGSRAALILLNAWTDFGLAHADWVTMAREAKSPMNERCLLKRGYKLQEMAYLLEVECPLQQP